MRKMLIAALAGSLLFAGTAFAQQARDNVGCGLGTLLWGERMENAMAPQVLAVTTNGTSGTQTFGISSGTSECRQPESILAQGRLMEFTVANMDRLASEIAAGQGESLSTLAELMEVPESERTVFYANLQRNFPQIIATGDEDAATFLDRIVLASY